MMPDRCFAGLDLGTSGCRLMLIDQSCQVLFEEHSLYPAKAEQTPELWWQAVQSIWRKIPHGLLQRLDRVAVDGTSGTVLLTDKSGNPTSPVLMYNDNRAREQARRIAGIAPRESGAHGATSGLAKLLWLLENHPDKAHARVLHQADWIAGKLSGEFGFSDENNCLKLGYDPLNRQWPDWLSSLVPEKLLPQVLVPGQMWPLSNDTQSGFRMCAGTTDSIAAFIATGASRNGDAVTSLGSTLALKIVSDKPVFAPESGVYSHRLGDLWLAGGASNTGGAVLLEYFSRQQLNELSGLLRPEQPTGIDYYPLPKPGERFPIADPEMQPRLSPRPNDDAKFLQAMLEGISRIEWLCWQKLQALGAPYPLAVSTLGGGAKNNAWRKIRENMLGVPVLQAVHGEAAFGAARLAMQGAV